MMEVVKLVAVFGADETHTSAMAALERALEVGREDRITSVAIVATCRDGRVWTKTSEGRNRLAMLGAVTDLQYELSRQGDP